MKTNFTRGSALDLEKAFEDKIAELSGVTSSEKVTSAIKHNHSGSTEDMMNAVRSRISELGGDITSCDVTQDDEDAVVLAARDPESQSKLERYLHNLIGDLTSILNDNGIFDTLFDYNDENLYMTVSTEEQLATQYTIPLADLKLDFEQMDVDIDYIIDGTIGKKPDDSVTAGYAVDPGYDFELEQMGEEAAELTQRFMAGDESPYDILLDLGYEEVEDDVYHKKFDKYTRVFDFNYNGNTITKDDYYCRYFVLVDDMIPAGKREVTLNLYDEALDPDHIPDEVVDETIEGSDSVTASYTDEDVLQDYTFRSSKQVPDSDGFMTDYTWYECSDGTHVFVFGDNDIYKPQDGYFDHVCDSEDEAQEWFDSYNGFADDDDDDFVTSDADDIYSCDEATQHIQCAAFDRDWYFGKEQADKYGDLIAEKLSGKTVSKRRDKAEEPGGLIYEANQLGIDMWDLLGALEGMCYQRRAHEIDDSTYQVN